MAQNPIPFAQLTTEERRDKLQQLKTNLEKELRSFMMEFGIRDIKIIGTAKQGLTFSMNDDPLER